MTGSDDRGPAGPQGQVGTPGRQGEAGVSGRQGEAGHIGLPGSAGEQGEQGAAGGAGPRGHAGPALSRAQVLVGAGMLLFVFLVLSVRQEIQQRSIIRNQQQIDRNQQVTDERLYSQCVALNTGTARRNGLIDAAIETERRRPAPDAQRIRELAESKATLLDCGPPR